MGNSSIKLIIRAKLFFTAVLTVLVFTAIMLAPGNSHTSDKEDADKKIELSAETLSLWQELLTDKDRTRDPAVDFKSLQNLIEQGFSDELVRLVIKLDIAANTEPEMPISVDELIKLKNAGIKDQTIRTLLLSEIRKADLQSSKTGVDNLGKKTITRSDGKKVIIYWAGDITDKSAETNKEQQEKDLKQALEILRLLEISIDIHKKTSD